MTLAVLVSLTVYSCLIYPTQVAQIVSIGLKVFGVGGDVSISFIDPRGQKNVIGKLKLLTPKNIYIKTEGNDGISVYSLSSIENYHIKVK